MTPWRFLQMCSAAVIAAGALTHSAQAQSEKMPMLDGMPADYMKRAMEHRKMLLALDESDQARSVYAASDIWPPAYRVLRVCFFAGSAQMRARIAKEASDWMASDNSVKFDFGDPNDPRMCNAGDGQENQIRISFDQPGQWSMAGVQSVVYVKQNEASMNYFDLDKYDPVNLPLYYVGAIRHEFGHALGLEHEHQSPAAKCEDEYAWDKLYALLGGPPDNWPKEYVDFSLRPLSTEQYGQLVYSEFDPRSIMIYSFPPEYFVKGTASHCFVGNQILEISPHDRAVIAAMYPADKNARLEQFARIKSAMAAIVDKAAQEGRKGAGIDIMKEMFERSGTPE